MNDFLKKYLLPDHSTRVQAVKLEHSWQTGMAHQTYPAGVKQLLGELVAAAVLLASNLKFDGSLILQLQGDGPIALIVVECTSELTIRATVTLREGHALPDHLKTLQELLNQKGQGRFIVVLDPNQKTQGFQPYQGVVPLEGDSVAQVLEHYMLSSEQLDTHLWLAANDHTASGLLLQRLPNHGGYVTTEAMNQSDINTDRGDETWERVCHLASTLKQQELLEVDTDTLIHRLFWQEDLQAFEPLEVKWHCPCSRERVGQMLKNLGQEEINHIVQERGAVEIVCNFCGKPYHFDPVDCTGLFSGAQESDPGSTLH